MNTKIQSLIVASVCGVLLTGGFATAFAQDTPPAAPAADAAKPRRMGMKKMEEALDFTDAQKAQAKQISETAKAEHDKIKASTLPEDQKKEKQKEITKTTRIKVMALMTPAQKAKMKQLMAANKAAK